MKQALSILARDTGELPANYQDAVKGVLTVSRPAAMGAPGRAALGPSHVRPIAFAGRGQSHAFKTHPLAFATIGGSEIIRTICKRQCLMLESGEAGQIRFVNRLFRLAACQGYINEANCASDSPMQQSQPGKDLIWANGL